MLGLFLVAWVVAPLLILAVSLGLGLLVRRLAGDRPGDVYLLPVGFAAALVLGSIFTYRGATAELTPWVLALAAIAGLVIERGWLLERLRPTSGFWFALAAAFIGFAVIAAPVVLSGQASFTGYGRIVDLGHHFDFAAYLSSHGRDPLAISESLSSYLDVSRKLLAAGYPGAWQADLTAYSRILGTDLIWIYQPLLAVTSAMGALTLYGLLGRAIESRPLRVFAAGVAIQANILYAYGLVGGFKELTAAFLLILTAALGAELVPRFASLRNGIPLAVALAACVADFSLGIVPWLGVIVGCFLVLALVPSRRRVQAVVAWASVGVLALVLAIPSLVEASKLAPVAAKAEGGSSGARTALIDLGNLAAAIPVRAATGIWPSEDYRYPTTVTHGLTGTLMIVVLALGAVGVVVALRRRDWGLVFLTAAGGVALAYYMARTGPWIQLKAIAVSGAVVLACAFAGSAAIGRRLGERGRVLSVAASWLLAAIVASAVLYGNALAYHDTTLAPTKRFRDLEKIGNRYASGGPAFYPDFEEDAEYMLRREGGIGVVDPPSRRLPLRRPGSRTRVDEQGFEVDLDQLTLPYVQSFNLIVRRVGPERSRPPSNWELAERTPYHEVWRKVRPARDVLLHEPYEGPRLSCARFADRARALGRKQPVKVAYVETPDTTRFKLGELTRRPPFWSPKTPSTLVLGSKGRAAGNFKLARTGDYRIWIAGDFGRVVKVGVDGRQVAAIERMHSYADQYLDLGRRRLSAGAHRVELSRPGGNFEPGNGSGDDVPVGPIIFELPRALPVRKIPVNDAQRVCRRGGLDWMEVVRR